MMAKYIVTIKKDGKPRSRLIILINAPDQDSAITKVKNVYGGYGYTFETPPQFIDAEL